MVSVNIYIHAHLHVYGYSQYLVLGSADGISYNVGDTAGDVLANAGPHQMGQGAETMLQAGEQG